MYTYTLAVLSLIALVAAGPMHVRQSAACPAFPEQAYAYVHPKSSLPFPPDALHLQCSTFQISDGIGGNAASEAQSILAPLGNCDLATVDAQSLANIKAMRDVRFSL